MSKCIGDITHDVFSSVGTLLSHSPGKSFGELFEEKKSKLDALQATLAEAVMPKFPPMPAVKYSDIGFGIDLHKGVMPAVPLVPVPNVSMVFDIIGAVFAAISSVLPEPPAPPPVAEGEEPAELGFCESVAAVGIALIKGMAPSVKVNGHWIGNAGTSIQHLPHYILHSPFPLVEPMAEGEIFMGSSTVLADGSPFAYQYLPSLSCNLVGVPAPIRPKKMSKPKLSLKAPTSSLTTVIPAGKPVFVGGPPTIDLFALAM